MLVHGSVSLCPFVHPHFCLDSPVALISFGYLDDTEYRTDLERGVVRMDQWEIFMLSKGSYQNSDAADEENGTEGEEIKKFVTRNKAECEDWKHGTNHHTEHPSSCPLVKAIGL
ncbi:hypothetical protein LshimejAT787_0107630 [Lyophyllum shimeji]|uniref:Uncharacterized protein n=1 Tax=Lyophyllum shimeji TaxID=47721 RepID=A0A9P3UHF6_LYOSH|nr:hypothetical protein LshimejAT787_0107630 [Lyophyllum shimeji]